MNDPKLKLAMAKLLPKKIGILNNGMFVWCEVSNNGVRRWLDLILETEWLYVIHLAEQTLDKKMSLHQPCERNRYVYELQRYCGDYGAVIADFNTRATAMCKVKGIAI